MDIRKDYPDEYRVWRNMRQRCNNPKSPIYHRYGGRGIKMCGAWDSFEVFLQDMGRRLSKEHSLERRDNERGYEPSNCYWATREQQGNNTRRSVKITYNGETRTITQWARITGIEYEVLRSRYRYGWTADNIFRSEKGAYTKERAVNSTSHLLTHNGETLTITQWAHKLGLTHDLIRSRIRNGWDIARTLDTPATMRRQRRRL